MKTPGKSATLTALMIAAVPALAQWTSPGSGVAYTPELLSAVSGGAIVGTWPDYTQAQDIIMSTGDTLLLQAGCNWVAATGVELRVHGHVRALGTPWEPIRMTAANGQANAWSGLILDDADSGSLLRCVEIRGGDDGLNCLGSSPTVEYCTLAGNFSSGINCFLSSHPVLRHTLIEGNSRYGVEITGGCSPVLEHCVIRGNNTEAASPRNAVSVGIQGVNSPRLVSCLLEGAGPANPASGFSLWMSGNPELRDCEIRDFRSGVVIQGAGAQGLLERCWIHSSRYSNPNLGGSGINVNTSAVPVFRGCCMEDNDWGVTITSACAPDFGLAIPGGGNRLHGNGNGGNIWDFYNNTTSVIQARGNWWGSSDPGLIEAHIHDDGDGAYGAVHTDPILADSLFAPFISPDLGFAALDTGELLRIIAPGHFRPTPGLSFTLEGPGESEALGDTLLWTPPAGADTLLTLLLRAHHPNGLSSCDTMQVWLRRALQVPELHIALTGSGVLLQWTEVAGALGYRVERSAETDFSPAWTQVIWEGPEREVLDPGILAQAQRFYRVVAVLPDR